MLYLHEELPMTTESKVSVRPNTTIPDFDLGILLVDVLNTLRNNPAEKKLKRASDLEYYAALFKNPHEYEKFLKNTDTSKLPGYLLCIEEIQKLLKKHMYSKDVLSQRYKEIMLFSENIRKEIEGKYYGVNSNIFFDVPRVRKAKLGERRLETGLAERDKPLGKLHEDDLYPMISRNQL